jgi:hypothetical protein
VGVRIGINGYAMGARGTQEEVMTVNRDDDEWLE